MEAFFNQNQDLEEDDIENTVTPESLAWKLLMDDDVENYTGALLPFVYEDNDNKVNNMDNINKNPSVRYDSLADQFQILISVYMEMIFGLMKINHVNSFIDDDGNVDDSIDFDATFKPDISKFTTTDSLIDIFREKFKKIRIFLSVLGIYDSNENLPKDYGSSSDYYCRVILKDSAEGKAYFKANSHWLNPETQYTFVIRNDTKKQQAKIDDFYAVCTISNLKVRISFSQINVITQNQHTK